jgi:hypothetical protein
MAAAAATAAAAAAAAEGLADVFLAVGESESGRAATAEWARLPVARADDQGAGVHLRQVPEAGGSLRTGRPRRANRQPSWRGRPTVILLP